MRNDINKLKEVADWFIEKGKLEVNEKRQFMRLTNIYKKITATCDVDFGATALKIIEFANKSISKKEVPQNNRCLECCYQLANRIRNIFPKKQENGIELHGVKNENLEDTEADANQPLTEK